MLILYKNIKSRRIEMKMSQQELAKKVGYTDRSSIAKIESGKVDLTQSKIKAIAQALNTTPSFLMGWEDVSEPLSEAEEKTSKLINIFNQLSDQGKDKVIDYSSMVLSSEQAEK